MNHILHIDASARTAASLTRKGSTKIVETLKGDSNTVTYRDLNDGLPLITESMVEAYFTDPSQRSENQRALLSRSDKIVAELRAADTIVIGLPMYNFGVPAVFKAWIDLAARAGETFRYTESGPVGLLRDKHAHIVIATGGTELGSEIDHMTPWLTTVLAFLGITDVSMVHVNELDDYLQKLAAPTSSSVTSGAEEKESVAA